MDVWRCSQWRSGQCKSVSVEWFSDFRNVHRGKEVKRKGTRPIIVKIPSGVVSKENKFATVADALEFVGTFSLSMIAERPVVGGGVPVGAAQFFCPVEELRKARGCVTKWQHSTRSCKCGTNAPKCGILLMNKDDGKHWRNELFELCNDCGKDIKNGHPDGWARFCNGRNVEAELIYGYVVKFPNTAPQIELTFGSQNAPQEPRKEVAFIWLNTRRREQILKRNIFSSVHSE